MFEEHLDPLGLPEGYHAGLSSGLSGSLIRPLSRGLIGATEGGPIIAPSGPYEVPDLYNPYVGDGYVAAGYVKAAPDQPPYLTAGYVAQGYINGPI
jgi:hypothetical protein